MSTLTGVPEDGQKGAFGRLLRWVPLARGGLIAGGLGLVALVAAGLTYAALTGSVPLAKSRTVVFLLLGFNLAIVLALAAFIAFLLVRLRGRRQGFAAVKLHSRLVGLFSLIAAIPAIIVAVFSSVFLFVNIESWFSARQRLVVENAETIANAYMSEHQRRIIADTMPVAQEIDRQASLLAFDPNGLTQVLRTYAIIKQLPALYLVKRDATVVAGVKLYPDPGLEFLMPPQALDAFRKADEAGYSMYAIPEASKVYGIIRLRAFPDAYLYVIQYVNADVIRHVADTQKARTAFEVAESRRVLMPIYFFLTYLIVALFILLAAVWLGIWAANRIVAPIGRLIGAAERVSEGDLTTRVTVGPSDDEIGSLGRVFNRMTAQLETQRRELVEANRQLDRRRRFTEAVLSGVTAGVIGLDAQGVITLANRSASVLLGRARETLIGQHFTEAVPDMAPLLRAAEASADMTAQGQVDLAQLERTRNFTVRVTRESSGDQDMKGFVVTFDDITELVAAQRMSAWADVARRIAHEIKNPLTPIQLSAERLRRKYRAEVREPDIFEQCTNTIIRQVSDIGRMVDEFSSFARMPAPVMSNEDLSEILRQAVFLQRVGHPEITFVLEGTELPVLQTCDRRLVTQALTNIIKNAAEAITTRRESEHDDDFRGEIRLRITSDDRQNIISVEDNGCGLPREQRHLLTEPYVTTRVKGTGLGLAIVKKIMEDHRGALSLEDGSGVNGNRGRGAAVRLVFTRDQSDARTAQSRANEREIVYGV